MRRHPLRQTHSRQSLHQILAHFGPVHYTRNVYEFRNVQDGHIFQQYMSGGHDLLTEGETPMTSVATYEGPA